jgi:mannitol-1-/sugar-/sorbitol-6-/2-deoxyglucose-6-phosphatase
MPGRGMLRAVIYDMDGVIVDTLSIGKTAEREMLFKYGISVTDDMYEGVIGLREDETIARWCDKYGWSHLDQKDFLKGYINRYNAGILAGGLPLPGVVESLRFFKTQGMRLGLASSSYMKQIQTVVRTLGIESYFDVIHSAEYESHGKPYPDVYLTTASLLEIPPKHCLAIEDSANGLLAARSAGMKCLHVTGASSRDDGEYFADATVVSLAEVNEHAWERLNHNLAHSHS